MPAPLSTRRATALTGLLLAALAGSTALLATDTVPGWTGCPLLLLFVAGAWWIQGRHPAARPDSDAPPPTPDEVDRRRRADEARALERTRTESERVETVLRAILRREGAAFRYRPPLGGHMDKREGTVELSAPLPVTEADLAALDGPLTRLETATLPDGRTALVSLSARDLDGGGIEARVRP